AAVAEQKRLRDEARDAAATDLTELRRKLLGAQALGAHPFLATGAQRREAERALRDAADRLDDRCTANGVVNPDRLRSAIDRAGITEDRATMVAALDLAARHQIPDLFDLARDGLDPSGTREADYAR